MNIGTKRLSEFVYRVTTNLPGWKEKHSRSLEGCQQHGFMEQNFAGKGLSINGNLKFTMLFCISVRLRILKYLLCQHNYSGLIHLGSTCRSFFGRNRVSSQKVDMLVILQYSVLKKSTSCGHEKILKMVWNENVRVF